MGIHLGTIELSAPVILAPLAGITDLPFRGLVRRLGGGLVVSEMIASRELLRRAASARRAFEDARDGLPMAVQLAGHDPAIMADAARLAADRGAAIIDINFGCPVKKVVGKLCGSALMREEGLAARIMAAVVAAVAIPVTVKMRTGWDEAERNAPRLAAIAEDCGIRMITVHGRTRRQGFEGIADWAFIGEVKRAVAVPVIANGDIAGPAEMDRCLTESGADGVMVGRAVRGRPWLPGQLREYLKNGRQPVEPSLYDRGIIMMDHYDATLRHYGTASGVAVMRKHLGWYARPLPRGDAFLGAVNREDRPAKVIDLIREHFLAASPVPLSDGLAA